MKREKVHRSEEEWRELIATYRASGKTQRAFLAEKGLPGSTFQKWRTFVEGNAERRFIDVTPKAFREPAKQPKVELEVSGVTIRILS